MQSTFGYLEMHSKGCYKFCTCSAILGELECLRNFRDQSVLFSRKFLMQLTYYKSENFSNSSLHEPPKFFQQKCSLTWGVKCEKLNLRKLQGIYQISFENCLSGRVILKSLAVLKKQKILGNICLSEQTFYEKQSLGAPNGQRKTQLLQHETRSVLFPHGQEVCPSHDIRELQI